MSARSQRIYHEINFLISEEVATSVRDFVREYLALDDRCVGRPNDARVVHTLCLDSTDFTLYRHAINDVEHRCELRVRYHHPNPSRVGHLEIKRRIADAVLRECCTLRMDEVAHVLAGQAALLHPPPPDDALSQEVFNRFIELRERFQAEPKLHIAFLREAYSDLTGSVRITLDRQIRCEPCFNQRPGIEFENPSHLFGPFVLLELNYDERFPMWFRELVEHFDLAPCEADKFIAGISACRERGAPRSR